MSDAPRTWYVGDRLPIITETINDRNGAVVDLTGATVTFKMRAVGSSTLKVNAAATVVTPAAGTVSYAWAALDVDTEGFYIVWWEATVGGKVLAEQESIIEFRAHGQSAGQLVELDEVRLSMGLKATDLKQDDDIRRLIPVVTRAVQQWAQREFVPTTAATRRLRTDGRLVSLAPYDLRTATTVTFDPVGGPAVMTVGNDYRLQPTNRPDGVYTELRISDLFAIETGTWVQFGFNEVDILGDWGFATVPVDVKEAAIIAIRSWLRRDTATYAQVDADMRIVQPEAFATYKLPPASKAALDPYKRMVV